MTDADLARNDIHPEDAEAYLACYRRILDDREASDCTVRVLDRNTGKYLWMHIFLVRQKELQEGRRKAIGFSIVVDKEVNSIRRLEQTQEELRAAVSELVEAQQGMKQSREMMETACSFADMWYFSYDTEKQIIHTGEKLQKEFGFPEEMHNFPEAVFEYKLILPEYEAVYREQFAMLRAGVPRISFEIRALLADNKVHWLRFKGQLLKNLYAGSKMAAVTAQIIDTEKAIEARLNLERKKLQGNDEKLLFYYVGNISQNTVVEYKSFIMDQPLSGSQLSLEEFIEGGRKWLSFPGDEKWLANLHQRERLLKNYHEGIVQEEYKTQIATPENRTVWAHCMMRLMQDPATGDILLYEYMYDIDEDQIIEAMLKMEMNYGYEVIGNLFVRDDQFTFLEIEQQSGHPDLNYMSFADYIREYAGNYLYPEDREKYIDHYTKLSEIAAEPDCRHSEVLYRTLAADGSIRYHKDDNYFYDKDKGIFLLTRREYTDIVRSEEEEKQRLASALAEAEEAGRAKNDFLARMSHDMRTPMNAIIGLTALTVDAAENPAEVRDNMAKMNSASDFLLGLVNDILDMAKIEDRSLNLNLEPYQYSEFLMNMRTAFVPQCESKGIRISFMDPKINPIILCDKTRLNQIFYNIFSNAVKYTLPGGSITYDVQNLQITEGHLAVRFVIADTGIGMSEEFQQHMFEPFTRESTAVTAELQGSGLGLSITRQLVELMGGNLRIISRKGQGTTVLVDLEFECLEENAKGEAWEAVAESGSPLLKGRVVLLVEDHPLNAEIAAKLLEKQGMTVLRAENGRVALEMFRASVENSIDVILMDIRMPEMDGLQATAAIRRLDRADAKTVPIIAMSANAYPEDVQKSLEAGMDAHLSKPIDTTALFRTLEERLG